MFILFFWFGRERRGRGYEWIFFGLVPYCWDVVRDEFVISMIFFCTLSLMKLSNVNYLRLLPKN